MACAAIRSSSASRSPVACGSASMSLARWSAYLGVPARLAAQPGPVARVNLLVNRVVGLAFHFLAGREAQRLGALAEPPARRLAGLGGVDVVAARALLTLRAALRLALPYVAEVITARRGDDGHALPFPVLILIPAREVDLELTKIIFNATVHQDRLGRLATCRQADTEGRDHAGREPGKSLVTWAYGSANVVSRRVGTDRVCRQGGQPI